MHASMHDMLDCAQKNCIYIYIYKRKKNQNAFKMIASVFPRRCGSYIKLLFRCDSHFQRNVIDNVEILNTFYIHITYFVFCTLTNYTHYMQINTKSCT